MAFKFCPCFLQALFVSFPSFIRKNNVVMESCTCHCLKSTTQVVCFLWKIMDFSCCTSCFSSHGPGMVSACAQGRDVTQRNEEFSLRKGYHIDLNHTHVVILSVPSATALAKQFLMPKPSWQQILSTGSPLPACLHPPGPTAAIPGPTGLLHPQPLTSWDV